MYLYYRVFDGGSIKHPVVHYCLVLRMNTAQTYVYNRIVPIRLQSETISSLSSLINWVTLVDYFHRVLYTIWLNV